MPNSCGRSARAGTATKKARSDRIAAVLSAAPREIATATSRPTIAATVPARTTASSSQPPNRYPAASRTWASHCWSVHGVPAIVNV